MMEARLNEVSLSGSKDQKQYQGFLLPPSVFKFKDCTLFKDCIIPFLGQKYPFFSSNYDGNWWQSFKYNLNI